MSSQLVAAVLEPPQLRENKPSQTYICVNTMEVYRNNAHRGARHKNQPYYRHNRYSEAEPTWHAYRNQSQRNTPRLATSRHNLNITLQREEERMQRYPHHTQHNPYKNKWNTHNFMQDRRMHPNHTATPTRQNKREAGRNIPEFHGQYYDDIRNGSRLLI